MDVVVKSDPHKLERELLKQQRDQRELQYHRDYKATSLTDAVNVRGQCTTMCPRYECLDRENANELSPLYETASGGLVDFDRAVKKYRRSAAGMQADMFLEDIRTPRTLQVTMRYLVGEIMPTHSQNELEAYNFIRDRIRAIRKDYKVQNYHGMDMVAVLQQSVRYLLHCDYRMHQYEDSQYSPKQNRHQLVDTLYTLIQLYDDHPEYSRDAPEFRAYYTLLMIHEPILTDQLDAVTHQSHILLNAQLWCEWMQLLRQASYLQACICCMYVAQAREWIVKSVAGQQVSLQIFAEMLLFESGDQCIELLGDAVESHVGDTVKLKKPVSWTCNKYAIDHVMRAKFDGKDLSTMVTGGREEPLVEETVIAKPPVAAAGLNVKAPVFNFENGAGTFGTSSSAFGGGGGQVQPTLHFGTDTAQPPFGGSLSLFGGQAPAVTSPFALGTPYAASSPFPVQKSLLASQPSDVAARTQVAAISVVPKPVPVDFTDIAQSIADEWANELAEILLRPVVQQELIRSNVTEQLMAEWYHEIIDEIVQDEVVAYAHQHMRTLHVLNDFCHGTRDAVLDQVVQNEVTQVASDCIREFEHRWHLVGKYAMRWRWFARRQINARQRAQRRIRLYELTMSRLSLDTPTRYSFKLSNR